jgi:hypothetical protein
MARTPAGVDRYHLYIAARRVLLDGLEALRDQREAITLVGAQAVYLRSRDASLTVGAFTSDADLSLDPVCLNDEPRLEAALRNSGFVPGTQPGQWTRVQQVDGTAQNIAVDLLVAGSFSGTGGQRGARIPPHSSRAARRVAGLEVAVIDRDPMTVTSLDPAADGRCTQVHVAGVAALLVAKAYKLQERLDAAGRSRVVAKDAGDVIRLMTTSDVHTVAETFDRLVDDDRVGAVTRTGLRSLHTLFGGRAAAGTNLAVTALEGAMAASTIRALGPAYLARLPPIRPR